MLLGPIDPKKISQDVGRGILPLFYHIYQNVDIEV